MQWEREKEREREIQRGLSQKQLTNPKRRAASAFDPKKLRVESLSTFARELDPTKLRVKRISQDVWTSN
jgi:hypothetical protein